ncbi:MAG: hypothetical protein AB7N61_21250 [Acidimicrobiia bacterium]
MTQIRIDEIELVGGSRSVTFDAQFSVVKGSITTGKTTLVRLLRALLGRVPKHLPPETGAVRSVRGRVAFGEEVWEIDRPLVTTKTAVVSLSRREAAPDDGVVLSDTPDRIIDALRLPAEQATATSHETYLGWLLDRMDLPEISVPRARTDAASPPTPVTVNDWLLYCIIRDDEIDTMVFGHRDSFVDRKRRAVFEINYGIYDAEVARLEAQLRSVELQLADLDSSSAAVRRFLSDTPFQSIEVIDAELAAAREAVDRLSAELVGGAAESAQDSSAQRLRLELVALEEQEMSIRSSRAAAAQSMVDLEDLRASLAAQSQRLVRAIVADEWLVDFDFVVCPRCGTAVREDRVDEAHCYLCLQVPHQTAARESLILEQERIASQIVETEELVDLRRDELAALDAEHARVRRAVAEASAQLDRRTAEFVSRHAESMVSAATARALVEGRVQQLRDYRVLLSRYADLEGLRSRLEEEQSDLADALGQYAGLDDQSNELLTALEQRFTEYLQRLNVSVSDGLPLIASINRTTYMPEVSGRSFDDLSSQGLTVLVNVAHALAHHTVSIDRELPLPGLLVLDGLSNNVGNEGFDLERRDDTYRLLMEEAAAYAGKLQVIALDNDVPAFAADAVVLTLTQEDRLIRISQPAASNEEAGGGTEVAVSPIEDTEP